MLIHYSLSSESFPGRTEFRVDLVGEFPGEGRPLPFVADSTERAVEGWQRSVRGILRNRIITFVFVPKVGDMVMVDGQADTWGRVEAVDGFQATVNGVPFNTVRLTPITPRCGELRVGSAMSRRGTNQYVICGATAKTVVTLKVGGALQDHDCCGWHSKALLKSPLYVSHRSLSANDAAKAVV